MGYRVFCPGSDAYTIPHSDSDAGRINGNIYNNDYREVLILV
jgi:hypothetical protein